MYGLKKYFKFVVFLYFSIEKALILPKQLDFINTIYHTKTTILCKDHRTLRG
jgi:hypothetical protein